MTDIKFCLEIWGTDYDKIKQTCLLAEELGYYGFYYGESLAQIDLDSWTILSALIPITKKIKLGPVITYILPQYRSLTLLAKQSITFQDISDGRLELRTGAGATLQYAIQWWYPYGIDYYDATKRVSIFEEGLQLLKKLFGDGGIKDISSFTSTVNFKGRFFNVNGASFTKPKTKIPITVAAKQEKMMKIAAKYADIWESSYLSPTQFLSLDKKFETFLQGSIGNASEKSSTRKVKRSIELDVLIADSQQELDYKKKIFAMERGPAVYNQILKNGLVGDQIEIRKRLDEYVDLGVEQFFLAFQDPLDLKAIDLFMKAVKN